jgi:isoleucyl-tRNA synthetase
VAEAREGLERYDATGAGRRIARFVDDLSNWYVRRARRRFWDPTGEGGRDTIAAFLTLHECLVTLARLRAPFTPFVAEALWRNLAAGRGDEPDSVHLSEYPHPEGGAVDPLLDEAMQGARDIVELGRRVRTDARVKVRQPLLEAVVHYPGARQALHPLLGLVAEELNVKRVVLAESAERFGRWRAKPDFRVLGPRLGAQVKEVASALAGDDGELASMLAAGGSVTVSTPSGAVALHPGDVELSRETAEGWGVATEGGLTMALELELTDELRLEGLARELVRLVQDTRKAAGLEVTDRIELGLETSGDLARALETHRDYVARETLARAVSDASLADADHRHGAELEGSAVTVTLRRA